MKLRYLLLFVPLAFAVAASCGNHDSTPGDHGTGGAGASDGGGGDESDATADGMCLYQHYFSAGCSVSPLCTGAGGSCYSLACGCSGKIIVGCANEFLEPYAYTLPVNWGDGSDPAGQTCDPNRDAAE